MSRSARLLESLAGTRVIPVLSLDDPDHAVGVARALAEGGLRVLELTLRSPRALAGVAAVRAQVPEVLVGVGTIRRPADLVAAEEAGAAFAVSPGLTPTLRAAALASALPLLPGVGSTSEAMMALEEGYSFCKLFPAAALGGVACVRAWAGPLPELRLCPTGGVEADLARALLNEPNVVCVGGSFMAPRALIARQAYAELAEQARAWA